MFCFQLKKAIDQDLPQDTTLVRLHKTFLERLEICTEDAHKHQWRPQDIRSCKWD